ncbi:MAG: CHASE2 domain-containing protein [Lachnospiraceae bacterium]|nr:CHASE2 domain-containing protein [Lachnospiraceae bacterium]
MIIDKSDKKREHFIVFTIAVVIAVIASIMAIRQYPLELENMAEDGLYQNAGVIPYDIKIIAIDEKTLENLGPYTDWDRGEFAKLLEILNQDAGSAPKVIGIDVVFSGTKQSETDVELARVCGQYDNIVMASTVTFDKYIYQDGDGDYYWTTYISGEGRPYDELAQVVDYGFTNAILDEDGIVRKAYTQMESNGRIYDSFAYRIASKAGAVDKYPFYVEPALVSNPGQIEKRSMSDVLDGTVPADYFDDCIVLIGAYAEGLMDSYRVPVDYSKEMYGVELQANYVHAFLNDDMIYSVNGVIQFLITFLFVWVFGYFALNSKMGQGFLGFAITIAGHFLSAVLLFNITSYKLNLLAVPIGMTMVFLAAIIYHYIKLQRKRMLEMRDMLFSMAEAMSEAIEGRTPYNANHTQNVAKRCMEMLDFINKKHKEKKTKLFFTEDDKRQLYLAAMLHDVGKMDIPLEIMDKPTKLGNHERELRDRLEMISLRIEVDALNGHLTRAAADGKQEKIQTFINNLNGFNCGRPLKEEEWTLVNEIAESVYVGSDGDEIPYMTEDEIADLYIKAGTLSEKERNIMQSHVVYTDKILSHIQFGEHFKDVRAMAANHHELLNGKGYPKGIREEEIDTMTRILTIMDIYDSLIADDRPYKKPKTVKVAFEILDEEAEQGKVDKKLLAYAKELYLKDE